MFVQSIYQLNLGGRIILIYYESYKFDHFRILKSYYHQYDDDDHLEIVNETSWPQLHIGCR